MSNDLVVGAWRNGLNETTAQLINDVEKRRKQGFRQLPYESTIVELVDLLDSHDEFSEAELLEDVDLPKKRAYKES